MSFFVCRISFAAADTSPKQFSLPEPFSHYGSPVLFQPSPARNGSTFHFLRQDIAPDTFFWQEPNSESFVYLQGWCYVNARPLSPLSNAHLANMLDRYRTSNDPIGDDYHGTFHVVIYDSLSGNLLFQPDHAAASPLYFGRDSRGKLVVSNRAILVANEISAAIDGITLMSHLRRLTIPLGRTFFDQVTRLMSGCRLTLNLNDTKVKVQRLYRLPDSYARLSLSDAVDRIVSSLKPIGTLISEIDKPIIDLTGGQDTRVLAASIPLTPNLLWRVAGSEDHPDVRIATQIAKALNLTLIRLNSYDYVDLDESQIVRFAVHGDGFIPAMELACRVQQEAECDPGRWYHFGGKGGEMLSGFAWKQQFLRVGWTNRIDYGALMHYRIKPKPTPNRQLFAFSLPSDDEHNRILMDSLVTVDKIAPDTPNSRKLDLIHMHRLCYMAGTTHSVVSPIRRVCFPFLTGQFLQALFKTSWRHRWTRQLQVGAIYRMNSAFCKFNHNSGAPMMPFRLSTLPNYFTYSVKLLVGNALPRIARRVLGLRDRPPAAGKIGTKPRGLLLPSDSKISNFLNPARMHGATKNQDESLGVTPTVIDWLETLDALARAVPNIQMQIKFNDHSTVFRPESEWAI